MQEIVTGEASPLVKVIGFAGSDKQDLIMYVTAFLKYLKRKILIIDLSDSYAVSEILETGQDMKSLTKPCIMEHRGIDYISRYDDWQLRMQLIRPYLFQEKKDYDYILVDFGYQIGHHAISNCALTIVVSDLQKHNIVRVKPLIEMESITKLIVLRDIISCKVKPMDLLPEQLRGKHQDVCMIPFEQEDYSSKLRMQYSSDVLLSRISKQMIDCIAEIIGRIEPAYTKKDISQCIAKLKRGR